MAKVDLNENAIKRMKDLADEVNPDTRKKAHTKVSIAKMFNITTARLNKEILAYEERLARTTRRKEALPHRIQPEEVDYFIECYTQDKMTLAEIAKLTLRSSSSIRSHLLKRNIPMVSTRKTSKPTVKTGDFDTDLQIGDKILCYYYNLFGEVMKVYPDYFRVWLSDGDKKGFFAHRPRSDLAKI